MHAQDIALGKGFTEKPKTWRLQGYASAICQHSFPGCFQHSLCKELWGGAGQMTGKKVEQIECGAKKPAKDCACRKAKFSLGQAKMPPIVLPRRRPLPTAVCPLRSQRPGLAPQTPAASLHHLITWNLPTRPHKPACCQYADQASLKNPMPGAVCRVPGAGLCPINKLLRTTTSQGQLVLFCSCVAGRGGRRLPTPLPACPSASSSEGLVRHRHNAGAEVYR